MADIAEFIRAQLDEAEQTINALPEHEGVEGELQIYTESNYPCGQVLAVGVEHARADIASKRLILDEVLRMLPPNLEVDCGQTIVLRALALPYAGKPGYREEWRPGPACRP